jgi:hypothetical protein
MRDVLACERLSALPDLQFHLVAEPGQQRLQCRILHSTHQICGLISRTKCNAQNRFITSCSFWKCITEQPRPPFALCRPPILECASANRGSV